MIKKKNITTELLKTKVMRKTIITLIGSLVLVSNCLIAQNKSLNKVNEENADFHLDRGEYEKAYEIFDQLTNQYPDILDYKFKLGICCLNYPERNARAIELFSQIRSVKRDAVSDFYLAKAYHVNYNFDEAITLLDYLLIELGKRSENKKLRVDVKSLLVNCKNGQILKKEKSSSSVELINIANTKEFEAVPILTSMDSVLIFTYVGKNSLGGKRNESLKPDSNGTYCSDIYKTTKNTKGDWTRPEPITELNTIGNDAALAISPDGDELFLFNSTNKNPGDIYACETINGGFSVAKPLNANINSADHWEGSCALSPDSRFLYFVSDRPGGFGGRDVWVSEFVNGDWGIASNLGPSINTPYDEDAPFMHTDGITLFFTSKGHSSMGGYDIMYAIKKDNGWSQVTNLGIPVNTTGDDNFFSLNNKCDKGIFSSIRSGGHGESDIYMVNQIDYRIKPPVKVLIGKVNTAAHSLVPSFEVIKKPNGEIINSGHYDRKTGRFIVSLSPGSDYQIKISTPEYENLEYDLITENSDSYEEIKMDFSLKKKNQPDVENKEVYAPEKLTDEKMTKDTMTLTVNDSDIKQPQAGNSQKARHQSDSPVNVHEQDITNKITTDPTNQRQDVKTESKTMQEIKIKERIGNILLTHKPQNFYFTVQIGAFRHPQNFDYRNLLGLGKITSQKYSDGITRFTQEEFATLIDAEIHRQKLIQRGVKTAWIVVFVNKKRKTLGEFLAEYEAVNVN